MNLLLQFVAVNIIMCCYTAMTETFISTFILGVDLTSVLFTLPDPQCSTQGHEFSPPACKAEATFI